MLNGAIPTFDSFEAEANFWIEADASNFIHNLEQVQVDMEQKLKVTKCYPIYLDEQEFRHLREKVNHLKAHNLKGGYAEYILQIMSLVDYEVFVIDKKKRDVLLKYNGRRQKSSVHLNPEIRGQHIKMAAKYNMDANDLYRIALKIDIENEKK